MATVPDSIGVTFQPGANRDTGRIAQTEDIPRAIQILSLRLPRVVSGRALAPQELLSEAAGGRAESIASAVVQSVLRSVLGGQAGPVAAGMTAAAPTSPVLRAAAAPAATSALGGAPSALTGRQVGPGVTGAPVERGVGITPRAVGAITGGGVPRRQAGEVGAVTQAIQQIARNLPQARPTVVPGYTGGGLESAANALLALPSGQNAIDEALSGQMDVRRFAELLAAPIRTGRTYGENEFGFNPEEEITLPQYPGYAAQALFGNEFLPSASEILRTQGRSMPAGFARNTLRGFEEQFSEPIVSRGQRRGF